MAQRPVPGGAVLFLYLSLSLAFGLLRSLSTCVRGRLLHYEQTIDRDDGSIVSHAAVGFYG